ncbi:protein-tyrosine phosphatase [Ophiostoma piceae UAMH 11346]|uniref:protein-tyrosine-phosphatase n=1 Tax=Ophiostoma piceae (strain UAMH 11346) TaxID=1262450 RepID=S3C369_OPHP1|nr:protein-tyrosine phosphatase [Ophiostoma piceae UAMH 11346]
MKTARSAPPVHTYQYQCRSTKSTTPLTSPRMMVYSVGQQHPPKLSPRHSPGVGSASRQSPGALKESGSGSSPSYFGLVVEPSADPRDSVAVPRDNWSSPSSSVKSFSAAVPKPAVPLDANPAFEAFRKQADAGHVHRSFSLTTGQFVSGKMPLGTPQLDMMTSVTSVSPARPPPPRRVTQDSGAGIRPSASIQVPYPSFFHQGGSNSSHDGSRPASSQMDVDGDAYSLHDSAYVSSDSKRNSQASIDPSFFSHGPRFESPKQMEATSEPRPTMPLLNTNVNDSRHIPFPLNLGRHSLSLPKGVALGGNPSPVRAETAPVKMADSVPGATVINAQQLGDLLNGGDASSVLLLDIRVSTHFSMSRIRDALNMCIPTTLLKRATFNIEKMRLTFANPDQLTRFSTWNETEYIVVYDNSLTEGRDTTAAANMLRKFTNEGYKGKACILRGGFKAFAEAYPDLIDHSSPSAAAPGGPAVLSLGTGGPQRLSIAPVIGGVSLPANKAAMNPFFSNIRQNMDLADGVGRIELNLPSGVVVETLPPWLREAADPADHGSKVSNRFLRIELAEKARMEHAFGVVRPAESANDASSKVQLCGVEKGGKNRYKDILPFEHARVRLQGRPMGDCDYVNASHLHASRTKKRYIASQAPLPDTYNDFWSMIWDEDVRVIVMLTAESEGGQIKCHPYWTNTNYGSLTLRLISEKKVSLDTDKYRTNPSAANTADAHASAEFGRRRAQTLVPMEAGEHGPATAANRQAQPGGQSGEPPFVVVRKFALGHRDHAFVPIREVTQLHYASWPDFGTPAQPSHLLALVELANMMQRAASPTGVPTAFERAAMLSSASQPQYQQAGGSTGPDSAKLEHIIWPSSDEAETSPNARPMLVHCSAGCGRTGTFCTVDSVVDMLKQQMQRSAQRAKERVNQLSRGVAPAAPAAPASGDVSMSGTDDYMSTKVAGADDGSTSAWLDGDAVDLVAGTVEDFRMQRISMVQTLKQYVLCYETIAEWVSKTQERRGVNARGVGRARSESMRMTYG